MQDYRNGNGSHGDWICLHEECTNWKNMYCNCVGMPYSVFLPGGEDGAVGNEWGAGE